QIGFKERLADPSICRKTSGRGYRLRRSFGSLVRPAVLRSHSVHDVVLARMLDHLQSEIVVRPDLGHWRMINLKGLDLLGEIGGVAVDVDSIANAHRSTGFQRHGHD